MAAGAFAIGAQAADPPAGNDGGADSLDRVWDAAKLHQDDNDVVCQAWSIVGRYHGQFWSVDASEGRGDDWENRRIYVGMEARLFHQWRLHAQIKVSEDFSPFYDELYQAFVEWSPDDSLSVRVGRTDFLFAGLERTMSSTKIRVFERGLLVNQVMPAEVVGAVTEADSGKVSWRAGVFSGSIEDEFTDFSGGWGAVAGVGINLPAWYEKGSLHLDYLYSDGDPENNALEPYDHVVSLWHQGEAGDLSLGIDLTWAHGLDGRPAAFGFTLLPGWVFARDLLRDGDALQAVLRLQYASANGDNGLQLQRRYEQEAVSDGYGDRYRALYAGLNYLVLGDRLKVMAGVEYAEMDDAALDGGAYQGWTWLAGIRMYL